MLSHNGFVFSLFLHNGVVFSLFLVMIISGTGVRSSPYFCNMHIAVEEPLMRHLKYNLNNLTEAIKGSVDSLNHIYEYDNNVFMRNNVRFQVTAITVLKEFCSSAECNTITTLLDRFTVKINSTEYCLQYLFTYRDFDGGLVGLAWKGTVCQAPGKYVKKLEHNTGLVTFINHGKDQKPQAVGATLAHEIGHNFGASHDDETEACKDDKTHIMAERGADGTRTFSKCSDICINENVQAILEARKTKLRSDCSEKNQLTHEMCFSRTAVPGLPAVVPERRTGFQWIALMSGTGLLVFLLTVACCGWYSPYTKGLRTLGANKKPVHTANV